MPDLNYVFKPYQCGCQISLACNLGLLPFGTNEEQAGDKFPYLAGGHYKPLVLYPLTIMCRWSLWVKFSFDQQQQKTTKIEKIFS